MGLSGSSASGTGLLLRLALRNDRVRVPVWAVSLALLVMATVGGFQGAYGTPAERERFAATVHGSSAFTLLYGPDFDLSTIGGMTAWRILLMSTVMTAVMSLLLAVRHTRAEEERGRAELLRSGAVGRDAPVLSCILLLGMANALVGCLATLAIVAAGLGVGGAALFGAAMATGGLCFGGVALLAAQLGSTGRSAGGLVGAVLGACFVIRAIGDVTGNGVRWASPLTWVVQARPYAGDRWWLLVPALVLGAATTAGAVIIARRRDLGAGLLQERRGPAASPAFRSNWRLAWRLQRGGLLVWLSCFVVMGSVVGAVADDVRDIAKSSSQVAEALQRMGGGATIVDAYLSAALGLFGLLSAAAMLQVAARFGVEESSGRSEPVLASAVPRWRWAGAHVAAALLGAAALQVGVGLAVGGAHAARVHDASQVGRVLGASLAQLPATWAIGALGFLAAMAVPRAMPFSWAAFGACAVIMEVGEVLALPGWLIGLSPFRHIARLPDIEVGVATVVLCAIAVAALTGGAVGLGRRDVR